MVEMKAKVSTEAFFFALIFTPYYLILRRSRILREPSEINYHVLPLNNGSLLTTTLATVFRPTGIQIRITMPEVKRYDAGDVPMRLLEIDGIYYPNIVSEESLKSVQETKAREDDVILVNFNKSGTHWLWEIMSMLYQGSTTTIPTTKEMGPFFEAMSAERLEKIPSPRVLNTHFRFDNIPKDMRENRVKMVLIHRNPKDIAVSMYHHHTKLIGIYDYHGKWEDYLQGLFLSGDTDCGSWFEYVLDWERVMKENADYPIHLMYYEDLKENCFREVKKMAEFLGLTVDNELITAVCDKCEFKNMVKDKDGLENEFWVNMWKDKKPWMYRKGQVGDWKNSFTVAQNEMFDKVYQEKMAESKLKIRFEL